MIITLANSKGGSGKSTIALNLAIKLASISVKTLLLDLDSQKSISDTFLRLREDKKLNDLFQIHILKEKEDLKSFLTKASKKYDCVVIDTAGIDNASMREAVLLSDLMIIPCFPSDIDIAIFIRMINLYSDFKDFNKNLKALLVINRAKTNPFLNTILKGLETNIKELIKEQKLKNIKLCKTILYDRQNYITCFSNGLGISEYESKNTKAKDEFDAFFAEIVDFVNK